MDPTPTLMGIPPELRIKIIKFVAGSFGKQLRIPCCSDCAEDGFSPSVDRENATDETVTLVPAGARDVLALSRVNKHVHAEIVATFFPHVVAHFCQTCAGYGLVAIQGLGNVFSPYKATATSNDKLKNALHNIQTIHYRVNVDHNMLHKDKFEDSQRCRLERHLKERLALMDGQRLFVESMNASPSVKKVKICCSLIDAVDKKSNIKDAFAAFEKLRADISLEVHLHVVDVDHERSESTLPTNGFPSKQHKTYLKKLQSNRPGPSPTLCLIEEWIHVLSWLYTCLPNLQHGSVGGRPGDLIFTLASRYILADINIEGTLCELVTRIWRAHDTGDMTAFAAGKAELMELWSDVCSGRLDLLQQDFATTTIGMPGHPSTANQGTG